MNISISELLEKSKNESLNIIDIRSDSQYRLGHIPNSKNIPQNYLLLSPEYYLNKTDIYYIYCQYGTSSKYTVEKLNLLGYKTINITGGYNTYQMMKSN